MSASFTEIYVNRKSERAFRRRAIKSYPKEMMEAIWGHVIGTTLHVHAFVPVEHKGRPTWLTYEEEELDDSEDDARDCKLELLGTIHTHPNCLDGIFSETDLREVQTAQDTVMGICAITQDAKGRRSCEIVYWPTPRPMRKFYL